MPYFPLLLLVVLMRFKSPNLQNSLPPPPQSLIPAPTAREDLSAPHPTRFELNNGPVFPLVQDEDFRAVEKRISLVTKKGFPLGFWLGNSNERLNSDGGVGGLGKVMSKMSLMPSRRSSGLLLHRTASKNGNTGFEDLKNFIKDGGDFAKEVAAILEERAELEAVYSKVIALKRCWNHCTHISHSISHQ